MKKLTALIAALALSSAVAGCSPRFAGSLIGAAIITAAVVGTAHAIAHHDAHFHDEYCGCARHWHNGRWVYHYHGYWEYYDPHSHTWYRYYD